MQSTEKTFLKNVPFFSQLDDEQLKKVAEVGHKESVEANTIVFHEGYK
jgi:CRP-like cAMP-binding protein